MNENISRNFSKPGLSGIMRVKNDASFIEASVKSCIDALDELIIVWNDCSDNSAEVIEKMRSLYPDKIKTFEYKHKVYSVNLRRDEYEVARSLPEDSPHLLCNYYNFALSKVSCLYAMKIDADQMYFEEKLRLIRNALLRKSRVGIAVLVGFLLYCLYRISFHVNRAFRKVLNIYGPGIPNWLSKCYDAYAVYMTQRGKGAISLSGINVFKDGNWCVSLGKKSDIANVLPPFNGEYDHLIFKVTNDCRYVPLDSSFYNELRNDNYTYIEAFKCPYSPIPMGFYWYHLNSMRDSIRNRILKAKDLIPQAFCSLEDLKNEKFSNLKKKIGLEMCPMNTLTLACFNYAKDKKSIAMYKSILE